MIHSSGAHFFRSSLHRRNVPQKFLLLGKDDASKACGLISSIGLPIHRKSSRPHGANLHCPTACPKGTKADRPSQRRSEHSPGPFVGCCAPGLVRPLGERGGKQQKKRSASRWLITKGSYFSNFDIESVRVNSEAVKGISQRLSYLSLSGA